MINYNISLAICNFFFGCFGFDCLCEYIKKYRPNQVRMYATMDAFMHAFMSNYMYMCVCVDACGYACMYPRYDSYWKVYRHTLLKPMQPHKIGFQH